MLKDLVSAKSKNSPLSSLQPCDKGMLEQVRQFQPNAPSDYLEFLGSVGAGEIGESQYNLYTGLVEPQDVFGVKSPEMDDIVLFGDDMQGVCAGFDMTTWKVVEIDPSSMTVMPAADSFEDFIRRRLAL